MHLHSISLLLLATVGSLYCKMLASFRLPFRGSIFSSLVHSHFRGLATTSSAIGESSFYANELKNFKVVANGDFNPKAEMLLVPLFTSKSESFSWKTAVDQLPNSVSIAIKELVDEKMMKSCENFNTKIVRLHPSVDKVKYLAFVGIGQQRDDSNISPELSHSLGKSIAKCLKDASPESISILPHKGMDSASIVQMLLGTHDALYKDNRFKIAVNEQNSGLSYLEILGCETSVCNKMADIQSTAQNIASGVNLAKDLVGAPANVKTPLLISEVAQSIARDYGLSSKILGEEECKTLNMGGYLAVQQGSQFPPQFIHLTYRPESVDEKELTKIALIGKGLTFDSGGYNIKAGPGSMIELMKFDMGGCAAVLGCAKSIAQLKPKNVEVHFISAVCENMISANAVRPGDIVRASNGKTIEILNTDAEGRLTLADALIYAEKLDVDAIIDLATLTGACIVGLGEKVAGLYSNDELLRQELENAAKAGNERVWNLPLEQSYKESLKGGMADLKNIAGAKGGGSITAALFLSEFVSQQSKWAHIDMAGPVWDTKANEPTGFGVKTLVEYVLSKQK